MFFRGDDLADWGLSIKASENVERAYETASRWLKYYRPDVVITEQVTASTRKGRHTRALIETIGVATRELDIDRIEVNRVRPHRNKYVEAALTAERYPQIRPWLPMPRRLFDHEPRNIILFEAAALWAMSGAGEPGIPSDGGRLADKTLKPA